MNIKSIYKYGVAAAGLLLIASCNEDPEYFQLTTYPDQMHVRVSQDEITLDRDKGSQTALTFTWDAAISPLSASDEVTYQISFYDADQKRENHSVYVDAGTATSISFTHNELNAILSRWMMNDQPSVVTAQLLATVHNEQKYVKPIESLVNFTVTCYEQYFFICVTDSVSGLVTTERMKQSQMGTGIYEVTLDMTPCSFHFLTSNDPLPAYGYSGKELQPGINGVEYVTEGTVTDFGSAEKGQRTIVVNTNSESLQCLMYMPLPSANMPWMVGSATDIGWVTNDPAGLFSVEDAQKAPYIYTWKGNIISGGEFKIGLGQGWGDPFFFAPAANTDPFADDSLLPYRYENGNDLKWVPTKGGEYTVELSLLVGDMHIKMTPVE